MAQGQKLPNPYNLRYKGVKVTNDSFNAIGYAAEFEFPGTRPIYQFCYQLCFKTWPDQADVTRITFIYLCI